MSRPSQHLAALLAALALAACGDSGGDGGTRNPPADAPNTVAGVAFDLSTGARLAGVAVSGGGKNAVTDARGEFTLSGLPAGKVVLSLEKDGYAPAYATPTVGPSAVPALVRLKAEGAPQAYDPATEATLSQRTEAGPYAVTFSPGSLDTTDPNLTVTVTPVDPTKEREALPGELRTAGTSGTLLVPVTFAEFTIRDSAGHKVQLKAGATATVELPIPASLREAYPLGAKIHCYAFNPASGAWEDFVEGTVRVSSVDGATPVLAAAIRHFSWYGAAPEGAVCTQIHGTIVSLVDGRPLRNAHVEAHPGGDAYSEEGGEFKVIAPQDSQITITATKRGFDMDGRVTGMPGAYYIEFGRASEWVGLGNVSCSTGEPLPGAAAAPPPAAAPITIKTSPLTNVYHQVNGIFSAPSEASPGGSAMVTIQAGVLVDGQLVDALPVSGAIVTLTRGDTSIVLPELLAGQGLYAPAPGSGFALVAGGTYQVDVDVDGNGSVDGTGSIQVVGEVAFTTPAAGGTYAADGFTLEWTDSAAEDAGYAPFYEVLVSEAETETLRGLYFGTARTFEAYDLALGLGAPLGAGSYTATLFAIGGFTQTPDDSWMQTPNFSGAGVGGWLFSMGQPTEVAFTLE